jgi:hypothetical protein
MQIDGEKRPPMPMPRTRIQFPLWFSLDPVDQIAGGLPRRQRRLVEAWAELHDEELLADWERLQAGQVPMPIDPLEGGK